jgi:hypothetical protein
VSRYISYENGDPVPYPEITEPVILLCGSMASFDHSSGISYRCNTCFAVVHSIGMPKQCKELYDMEEVVNKLKGKK